MSWKTRVASGLGGLSYAAGLHRTLLRGKAAVVVFHRVDDRYPGNPITVSTHAFRAYCRFFARRFDVVPFGTLVSMLEQQAPLRGQLAITFDDGYRDNFAVAAPILEQLGLPACFFLTTGFIESKQTPWWDREAGVNSEWMSWDHAQDLKRRGFEIGAHTVTHVDLGRLEGEGARREIEDSKCVLEARLSGPVPFFAYPYGRESQMTDANRELVRRAGFRCCPSAFGGIVRTGDDPFRLLRIPVTGWYRSPQHLGMEILRAGLTTARAAASAHPV
jgi:peptidoglycan/xylan/chitin deacetylase (PgdA/CDA1 family)